MDAPICSRAELSEFLWFEFEVQVDNAANENDEPKEFIPSNLQQLSASKSSCYFASFLSVIKDPSSSADKLLVFIRVSNK